MILKNCKVFLGDGEFHDCELRFGKTIDGAGKFEGEGLDLGGAYVVPGYVDIHSHGCMNRDFSDGDPEAMAVASSYYAQNGVTSFLATTMTLKEHQLMPAMACVKNAGALPGARCAGVNLEGPFLSYAKRGAQNPDNLHKPDADMFMRLHEASGGAVKLVTVAPEEEGGLEFVKRVSPVCTVSVGHTEADYDTAMRAYEAGASHATHLFNGMPGLHHRNPGVIGAAFDTGATVELICDGMHIHPSAVRCAMQLFEGRLALISDSLRCAGMPDGDYELGGLPIKLGGKVVKTHLFVRDAVEILKDAAEWSYDSESQNAIASFEGGKVTISFGNQVFNESGWAKYQQLQKGAKGVKFDFNDFNDYDTFETYTIRAK